MNAPRMIAVLLAGLAAHSAGAEPGDFTFKRVKVGEGQPGKRITVQINPEEQAALLAALPKVDPEGVTLGESLAPLTESPGAAAASYAWYWERVSPLMAADADRLVLALAALSNGPEGARVAAPRMQALQALADRYGTEILRQTVGTAVSPALVLAVMSIESGGRAEAVSPKGATGLMQLIPATASRFGVKDITDPAANIGGGVAYLDWLMGEFGQDPLMVIAAYNAGEGAVRANGGVPPYAETRDYVPKVLAAWQVAQGLCMTPPELMSDPCVFRIIAASADTPASRGG